MHNDIQLEWCAHVIFHISSHTHMHISNGYHDANMQVRTIVHVSTLCVLKQLARLPLIGCLIGAATTK